MYALFSDVRSKDAARMFEVNVWVLSKNLRKLKEVIIVVVSMRIRKKSKNQRLMKEFQTVWTGCVLGRVPLFWSHLLMC